MCAYVHVRCPQSVHCESSGALWQGGLEWRQYSRTHCSKTPPTSFSAAGAACLPTIVCAAPSSLPCPQLAHLLAEFMAQPGVAPVVEQEFLEFLSQRATRCGCAGSRQFRQPVGAVGAVCRPAGTPLAQVCSDSA